MSRAAAGGIARHWRGSGALLALGLLIAALHAPLARAATTPASGLPTVKVTLIALNPQSTSQVYVGTQGGGVFVSNDDGATFTPASNGLQGKNIGALVVNSTSGAVFVSTEAGLQISTNGGASWAPTAQPTGGVINTLLYDPRDSTLYAGTSNGLRRSTDGGATWQGAGGTGKTDLNGANISSLALDSVNPQTLYAATNLSLLQSTDGGQTWHKDDNGIAGAVGQVLVDPTSDTIYSVGASVFSSTNGGAGWTQAANGLGANPGPITLDPLQDDLYIFSGGKIYRSQDHGASWYGAQDVSQLGVATLQVDRAGSSIFYGTSSGMLKTPLSDLQRASAATAAASGSASTSTALAASGKTATPAPTAGATPAATATSRAAAIHVSTSMAGPALLALDLGRPIILLPIALVGLVVLLRRRSRRQAPLPAPVTQPLPLVTPTGAGPVAPEQRYDTMTGMPSHSGLTSNPISGGAVGGHPLVPGQLLTGLNLHGYELRDRIGKGGMAEVYRAHQPALDRDVAIKILPAYLAMAEGFLERFEREAKSIGRLNHPNILAVHDYGQQDGITYLVMAYASGGTLMDQLARPMPLAKVDAYVGQMARALHYAHGKGIIHRDVKPQNMLLSSEDPNHILLSDFGIAKVMEGSSGLTKTGMGIGTPEYMPPEQSQGGHVDARSDIYSLGVVAYHMITGQPPFKGDTPIAIMIHHISEPVPRASLVNASVSKAVEDVLMKAMAKSSEQRYQTAIEFAQALHEAIGTR